MHYKEEKLLSIATAHNGHFFSKMADEYGIERRFIQQLIQSNQLLKVSSGAYCLPDTIIDYPYIFAYFHKHCVFDLTTSLMLHGLIAYDDRVIEIALPRGSNTTRYNETNYFIQTRQPLIYSQGITKVKTFTNHSVHTYNLEMTLVHLILSPIYRKQDWFHHLLLEYLLSHDSKLLYQQAILIRKKEVVEKYITELLKPTY